MEHHLRSDVRTHMNLQHDDVGLALGRDSEVECRRDFCSHSSDRDTVVLVEKDRNRSRNCCCCYYRCCQEEQKTHRANWPGLDSRDLQTKARMLDQNLNLYLNL